MDSTSSLLLNQMKIELFDAVKIGNYDDVRNLLTSFNSSSSNNNNIMLRHKQGNDGFNASLHELLNCTDSCSMTPLHIACTYNYYTIVQLLLQYNVIVHMKDDLNQTPLHVACLEGHTNIVQLLLLNHQQNDNNHNNHRRNTNTDVDVNAIDLYGNTSLIYAAKSGYHEIVSLLLSYYPTTININSMNQCDQGNTALIYACQNHHYPVIQQLLSHNSSNCTTTKKQKGRQLLKINWKNQSLHTALYYTMTSIRTNRILNLFIQYAIHTSDDQLFNIAIDGNTGNTPLHIACSHNDNRIAISIINQLLLNDEEGINKTSNNNNNNNDTQQLRLVDINCMNYNGDTPLLFAIQCGHLSIVQLLLRQESQLQIDEIHIHIAYKYRFSNTDCYTIYILLQNEYRIRHQMKLYQYLLNEWVPTNVSCNTTSLSSVQSCCSDVDSTVNKNSDDQQQKRKDNKLIIEENKMTTILNVYTPLYNSLLGSKKWILLSSLTSMNTIIMKRYYDQIIAKWEVSNNSHITWYHPFIFMFAAGTISSIPPTVAMITSKLLLKK